MRLRLLAVASIAALATALATAAQAQLRGLPEDSELTPEAKPPSQWKVLGGAVYAGQGQLVGGSPTPFAVDFFSTAFSPLYRDSENPYQVGFFAGAECMDDSTPFSQIEERCDNSDKPGRHPSIYKFWIDDLEIAHVERVELGGSDPGEPGFVGAVAWIDGRRALAVGGTGTYPRRERPASPGGNAAYAADDWANGAGRARAWLYENGSWRELRQLADGTPGDELPDAMSALTALDCRRPKIDSNFSRVEPPGTCLAGGMQQLWWWRPAKAGKPEGFAPAPVTGVIRSVPSGPDGQTIPNPLDDPLGLGNFCLKNPREPKSPPIICYPKELPSVPVADFHFRVRQIRFAPGDHEVVAVTSGCCSREIAQEANGLDSIRGARLLTYYEEIRSAGMGKANLSWKWRSEPLSVLGGEDASSRGAPLPDSYYGVVYGDSSNSSYDGFRTTGISAIASPGAEPDGKSQQLGSRIVARLSGDVAAGSRAIEDPTSQALDSVRLLATDGDYEPTDTPHGGAVGPIPGESTGDGGDGMLDWAVGRFKDSEQGIAYTTLDSILPLPAPLTCKAFGVTSAADAEKCELVEDEIFNHDFRSKRLVAMGTHALNALSFVPGTNGGLGWAAGDRGALARLGDEGALGAGKEPDPPALKPGRPKPLSERRPFDPYRPAPGQAGAVPALADQPLERLAHKTLVPWGTADPSRPSGVHETISSIAMSRDGSEGWAVGGDDQFAIQHFDGERWSRCDTDGLGGVYEPDAACEELGWLLKTNSGKERNLKAIARIPFENDGDPTNDDKFEAIAVGSKKINAHDLTGVMVLRYRDFDRDGDAEWDEDYEAENVILPNNQVQIAFTAPDDGWVAVQSSTISLLYHFYFPNPSDNEYKQHPDGHWISCSPSSGGAYPSRCGENVSLVAPQPSDSTLKISNLQLQAAGKALFAAGLRKNASAAVYPFVVSKQPGKNEPWRQEYDPGCVEQVGSGATKTCRPQTPEEGGNPNDQGVMYSFSVAELDPDPEHPERERIAGWLIGKFGSTHLVNADSDDLTRPAKGPVHVLMRRDPERCPAQQSAPDCSPWSFREVKDAADDLIPYTGFFQCTNDVCATGPRLVSFKGADGRERSFLMPAYTVNEAYYPPLEYDPKSDRWRVMRAPFVSSTNVLGAVETAAQGHIVAAAPDNRGGLWVAGESGGKGGSDGFTSSPATFFYRYADVRRKEVFEEAPNPVGEPITGLAGTPDGGVWATTESDRLYHYDRLAGWERARIGGWDPGRVVTRPSHALAVAVNDAGVGIVVGEQGRIANISPEGVALDPASTRRCSDEPSPPSGPCGTPRDLRTAAVAPDGSAIAAGERLTLIWRPANGQFRLISPPRAAPGWITGVSMPEPGRAWIATEQGEIWAGTLVGERWRWSRESKAAARNDTPFTPRLNAIKVQADGRGLAVGMRGAMLERSSDGQWRRFKAGFTDHLYSIAFPPSGYGDGVLVGGNLGVILTRVQGRFRIARQADSFDPLTAGIAQARSARIVGLALSAGTRDGDVEAWAASKAWPTRTPAPSGLLHYGSDGDPLLHPESRARPLPDAPTAAPGEVTLAAFGRSECQRTPPCEPFQGTNLFNEVIARRIEAELTERRRQTGGPLAALSTGDLGTAPGRAERFKRTLGLAPTPFTPLDANPIQDQWRDLVADPLQASGVPLFAVPGKTDLSRARTCGGGLGCIDTQQFADPGVTMQWRRTFAAMPAPWGSGPAASSAGVRFRPVEDRSLTELETVGKPEVPSPPDTNNPSVPKASLPESGARTHYALDMVRQGKPPVRLIFIDNSFARSLAASDPDQNPIEAEGGQAAWLERVLCIKGETCTGGGSRRPDQPAIVVSNAPTYSYGPGGVDATQADGSILETLLFRHRATAVISGRLGWNGLFYTIAPGLHAPCPGGEYPERPPHTSEGLCTGQGGGAPKPPEAPGAGELADSLGELGAPLPAQVKEAAGAADEVRRPIPNLIAASAGGRFGPRGDEDGEASKGFWHGYGVMRVRADGEVIVEQRPIFDWVGIEAQEHTLRPGQKMTLRGFGREPLGTDTTVRFDRIDSPAITHRYDLLEADPEQPWLPKRDADGNYVPLDPSIATVDSQSGRIRAGRGNHPRAFAVALLSVGEKSATYPLVFEPRRSFRPKPAASLPALPLPKVAASAAAAIQAPQAPPPVNPPTPQVNLPVPPAIPSLPTPTANPTQPPAPPAPPPPPVSPSATPLDLVTSPVSLNVAPQATVIPPPAPPIQPAPPGGARREARQRQAATQKSGADSAGGSEGVEASGDSMADSPAPPHGAMTRRDRIKPAPSITTINHTPQPSAWPRTALYGGGLTTLAALLALGWNVARPKPRHRPPERPAPAHARVRYHRQ